jgi:hypothetical protein
VVVMMQVLVVMEAITLAVAMISGSAYFCCNLQACRQHAVSSSIPCLVSTRTHSSVSSTMDQTLVLWVVAGFLVVIVWANCVWAHPSAS